MTAIKTEHKNFSNYVEKFHFSLVTHKLFNINFPCK